jgi:hypothetical protein
MAAYTTRLLVGRVLCFPYLTGSMLSAVME